MVNGIREVETALGNGIKEPNEGEEEIKKIARKSIVAQRDISAASILKENDSAIKRPGTGIEPQFISYILGMKVCRDIKRDEILNWDALTWNITKK